MSLNLIQLLQRIRPTGPEGFEGLIAALLEALTGAHFHLASGGYQAGRDMSTRQRAGGRDSVITLWEVNSRRELISRNA